MRAKLHTSDGLLGYVELADGVDVRDVVVAIRDHRLFCTLAEKPAPVATAEAQPEESGTEAPQPRRKPRA